jgi:tetratricopeptide (TPR) repeat protein
MPQPRSEWERAEAAYLAADYHGAGQILTALTESSPSVAALQALCLVRRFLSAGPAGTRLDAEALRAALDTELAPSRLEADRLFVRGWLHWLAGEWEPANSCLLEAVGRLRGAEAPTALAEAAYWLARVRLLLGRDGAVAEFETVLRTLGGCPRANCWYVDLLWRAFQAERAEQLWKVFRGNRRVRACEEVPLLEARVLLRAGEALRAENQLRQANPRGGILQVEKALLLAWAIAAQDRPDEALTVFREAEAGPFPASALRTWQTMLTLRGGHPAEPAELPRPPAAAIAWLRWQHVRRGEPLLPWLVHQAAQTLVGEQDPIGARAWIHGALAAGLQVSGPDERARLVAAALPELERLARARLLADVVRFDADQPALLPGLLADAVDLLQTEPEGQATLAAALRGDLLEARQALAVLAERDDLVPRLAHHLALIYHRAALFFEDRQRGDSADACWRLAWLNWLRLCATLPSGPAANEAAGCRRRLLVESLLGIHRQRLNDLLARNDVDRARRHWKLVHGLADQVRGRHEALAREIDEALDQFREEWTTEYLTITREAMRHGDIAEGWRADYEKGLAYLRRCLSLDPDNRRLLTALVEVCGEWFLDCYNNEDPRQLWRQVDRFTPFALKLSRLVQERPGEWAARMALSEFTKYRGFIAAERGQKAALYREALHLNPANENVRELLASLEAGA